MIKWSNCHKRPMNHRWNRKHLVCANNFKKWLQFQKHLILWLFLDVSGFTGLIRLDSSLKMCVLVINIHSFKSLWLNVCYQSLKLSLCTFIQHHLFFFTTFCLFFLFFKSRLNYIHSYRKNSFLLDLCTKRPEVRVSHRVSISEAIKPRLCLPKYGLLSFLTITPLSTIF